MAKLVLEGSNASRFPVLPADSIIGVEVLSVSQKDATNNKTGETWQKLEFEFEITSVPDALGDDLVSLVGSRAWGSTPMRFTLHPDNRLRQWIEALLGGLQLDEGFELDTDSLVGRRARAVISNYKKRDGTEAHQVASLLPLADGLTSFQSNVAASTSSINFAAVTAEDEPPF